MISNTLLINNLSVTMSDQTVSALYQLKAFCQLDSDVLISIDPDAQIEQEHTERFLDYLERDVMAAIASWTEEEQEDFLEEIDYLRDMSIISDILDEMQQ